MTFNNKKNLFSGVQKSVFVTEKFSVAETYAEILGVTNKENGYYENESYIITWCIGHLVTLAYPEEYSKDMKKWDMDKLPFLPETYRYKVIESVASQFKIIKKLYHRSDIDAIFYAGDSGREGIYIQALVRQMAGHNPSAEEYVVWIDSQTEEEIKKGIENALPFSTEKYKRLTDAGYERAIEDYATGINFSRLLTLKYAGMLNRAAALKKYTPISVGRVMSCVLGMVVNREREILDFKSIPFYKPKSTIKVGENLIEAAWKVNEKSRYFDSPKLYSNDGFKEMEDATACIASLPEEIKIQKIERKQIKKTAPTLFNLAELQGECTKKFKISPDETLAVVQSLYEQGMTTYPRTDARVLTTAIAKEIYKNIHGLTRISDMQSYCNTIINNKWYLGLSDKRYVDDSQVTDHYAIIPTGKNTDTLDSLNDLEKDIYFLIIRRFLAIFFPVARYEQLTVTEIADAETFYANCKVLVDPGYMEVLGTTTEENDSEKSSLDIFSKLKEGQVYPVKYDIKKGQTTPPKRYTSGNMVLAMENAGQLVDDDELRAQIKKNGIGTSATRAETIKKLVKIGYIDLNKKTQILTPSDFGNMVYEVLICTIPEILNPRMTASWEKGLGQIETGNITPGQYRGKLEDYIKKEAEKIKGDNQTVKIANNIRKYAKTTGYETDPDPFESKLLDVCCPECGRPLKTTPFGYACENYGKGDGKCYFAIGSIANVKLSEEQVDQLIKNKKTPVINEFVSKDKNRFSAALVLSQNEEGKHVIQFDFTEVKAIVLPNVKCPCCGSDIIVTKFGYGCSKYEKGNEDSCKFFIGQIAKKYLKPEQVITLLKNKRVGPIKGFTSKEGKKFEACLVLNDENKVTFEFPEEKITETQIECPICKSFLKRGNYQYKCECGYKIPYVIAGRKLTEEDIRRLITSGRTTKLKGFKSKKGKLFEATLIMDEDGTIKFEF